MQMRVKADFFGGINLLLKAAVVVVEAFLVVSASYQSSVEV